MPVVQAGVTNKETLAQIATLFNANLTFLPLAGGTLTGPLTLNADAASGLQAVTLNQLNAVAAGITVQGAVRLGSTAALTATYSAGALGIGATLTNAGALAALSLDGTLAVTGDRVLIKNQAAALQNGIYTVTNIGSGAVNWVLTRALDYDQPSEIQPGDLVVVNAGATLASSSWLQTATVVTVGASAIVFSQFSAALPISIGNGGTGATTAAAARAALGITNGFSQINVQRVTAAGAGTYTPTANMAFVLVRAQAGGGGGGGTTTSGAGTASQGGGGGGGEYIEALFTAADIGASKPYVVGAAGLAGPVTTNGGAGGQTTFNAAAIWIVTNGGGGGIGSGSVAGASILGTGGAGGAGGFISIPTLVTQNRGGSGATGFAVAAGSGMSGFGGAAGSGAGGAPTIIAITGAGGSGVLGSGGSGASSNAGAQNTGGVGGDGFIEFIEYIA